MDKRTYNFSVGVFMMILAFAFLILPGFLNVDALIPFLFALVSFAVGISFFYTGLNEK